MKWQETFIVQKSRFMKMWAELRQFRDLAIIVPLVGIWLHNIGVTVSLPIVAMFVTALFILVWILGVLWDRTHMFHYEAKFNNERNNVVMKQQKDISKIRKLLEKLK